MFVATIPPKDVWHTCLKWLPVTRSSRRLVALDCNAVDAPLRKVGAKHLPNVSVETPNPIVDRAWDQAVRDLEALKLEDPSFERGVFIPAAGVPWFVTLFGRDSLIVSMQGISGFPEFAGGALRRLSELQATEDDPERDMEPGKIPHEIRHGELAQLKILPYQPYYGTHDATSLFVIVLSYLYHWSADPSLLRRYLPNAEAAMAWIDKLRRPEQRRLPGVPNALVAWALQPGLEGRGRRDRRGRRHASPRCRSRPASCRATCTTPRSGWPRSTTCSSDPRMPSGCGARRNACTTDSTTSSGGRKRAPTTWGSTGAREPIRSVASNAGHLLQSGIVPPERAERVVRRLMAPDMWSGWGIRTLSSDHPYYNPFSYQTGSVWPHDNATIAGGFRRYGFDAEAAEVAKGIFDAAERLVGQRLPELFSGLPRVAASFPVPYLGANVPQAWAAGSVFRFVAILCGLHATTDADGSRLYVNPALPEWMPEIRIRNLRVGGGSLDVHLADGVVEVLSNTSKYEVVRAPAPGPLGPRTPAAPES